MLKAIMAQTLTKLMKSRHITAKKLASDLGVPYTTVLDWLHGTSYPRSDKIEKLAEYFNVDPAYLVEGKIRKNCTSTIEIEHIGSQAEPLKELLDAYLKADKKTQTAVRILLEIDYRGE